MQSKVAEYASTVLPPQSTAQHKDPGDLPPSLADSIVRVLFLRARRHQGRKVFFYFLGMSRSFMSYRFKHKSAPLRSSKAVKRCIMFHR